MPRSLIRALWLRGRQDRLIFERLAPPMTKTTARFWIRVGCVGILIHAVFCYQAYLPLQDGGMASEVRGY